MLNRKKLKSPNNTIPYSLIRITKMCTYTNTINRCSLRRKGRTAKEGKVKFVILNMSILLEFV